MASESRYRLIVAPPVQRRMREHGRWWQKHRKGAATSFGDAVVAAYEQMERAPKLGVQHEIEGSDLEVWTTQLTTGHILYFTLVSKPPLLVYIRVIGVKGPGEAEPFLAR